MPPSSRAGARSPPGWPYNPMAGPSFHIMFEFRPGPYGGANQFLKALRDALARAGHYADDLEEADVILFNSHHQMADVFRARRSFPGKILVHRVDGPMGLYNAPTDKRDGKVITANRLLADATVFQSRWSRGENHNLDWPPLEYEAVIPNAPDPDIFNAEGREGNLPGGKVKLIATSWSDNPNKGSDVYKYLDDHLDFSRYEMTFVGNSQLTFGNIRRLPPVSSEDLAEMLRGSDVFITASQKDPCSNSLIEALHCGLPAVARNDGGHPEIIGRGGVLFETAEEVPALIDEVCGNYDAYVERIALPSISEIAKSYLEFAQLLMAEQKAGRLIPKRLGTFQSLAFRLRGI